MENNLRKIVAPIKGKDGKKPFWTNIGITGMKGGNQWMKFNVIPTGWDGYCMAVEMDKHAPDGPDKTEQDDHSRATGIEPERAYEPGSDEGPGY